ncbi:copper-binding protein [Herminiimonas sp. CN]|uniref:copper-binding protein n=1 Tax=Herminiimonas sp. CN TaxID=1349818 RepID=UPI000474219E|nr:copper-binding protein [Herminiimonas sp. CN]
MSKIGCGLALACALAQPASAATPEAVSDTAKKNAVIPAEPVLSEGVVKKVDKAAGKITIQHGEIRNLGMVPMTMMFRVKDQAMLEQVQVEQKIRFHVDIINNAYTVVRIEPER